MGSGLSRGSRTHPPSSFKSWWSWSNVLWWLMYGCWEGIGGVGCVIRRDSRRHVLSQWMGLGPSGVSSTHPPLPLVIWGKCWSWSNISWWLFYGCFEGIGVEGCMIHREGRYSPSEWDWAPVVDYALIPPSPLLNFFIGVAVYFEPKILLKIKYINYSLFTLWIPTCLHAQPSIHAALIFSLVLFVYVFFKC